MSESDIIHNTQAMRDLTHKVRDKGNAVVAEVGRLRKDMGEEGLKGEISKLSGVFVSEMSGLRGDIARLATAIESQNKRQSSNGEADYVGIIKNLSGFANKFEKLFDSVVASEEIKPETKTEILSKCVEQPKKFIAPLYSNTSLKPNNGVQTTTTSSKSSVNKNN